MLYDVLQGKRDLILKLAKEHGIQNVRILGSVAISFPKAIHLPPTHWAPPFSFLEVGVFSPKNDKFVNLLPHKQEFCPKQ